jgi:hypothetical protein
MTEPRHTLNARFFQTMSAASSRSVEQRMPVLDVAGDTEHWFAPTFSMLPLSKRSCRVRNPVNGVVTELDAGEYAVLATCEGCRTLTEHVARAIARLRAPEGHGPAVHKLLESCARRGLLISFSDLVARLGEPHGATLKPLAGIVVRTADRPQTLARLLSSAAALQARTRTAYRWHVLDDSRRAGNRAAGRATTEHSGLDATWQTLDGTTRLESELVAEFPALAEEIRWLLGAPRGDEVTYGRPLNHALLRFAGTRFLVIDDDVLLQPRRLPATEHGFAVSVSDDELLWYQSLDEAQRACSELDVDPIAEHARWLGLPLADAWRQAEGDAGGVGEVDLEPGVSERFTSDARVAFTQNQVLGDPGYLFPYGQLKLSRRSRQWLAAHPAAAEHAFRSKINWRGAPGLRLAAQRWLTTTTLAGIDNTRLVAPTSRSARGEDMLLGRATQCAHPGAWIVDLPFALLHLRASHRPWPTAADGVPKEPPMTLLQIATSREQMIAAASPAARLAMLGSICLDTGSASDVVLRELLETTVRETAAYLTFAIHDQLDDASLPATWKDVLRNWLSSPVVRLDDASVRTQAPSIAGMRSLFTSYGRALHAWPQLWSWCRDRYQ